jgi:cell division protein FtsQ
MTKQFFSRFLMGRKASSDKRGGQPRRRVGTWWRNKTVLIGVATVFIIGSGAGGTWLWQSGWIGKTADSAKWELIAASANIGLKVNEVLVTGRDETSRKRLLDAVRLVRGAPILAFDPSEVRERVEALPWIKKATVQRLLPDTVVVRIIERQPLALWQHDGQYSLIDHNGTVIVDADLKRFSNLLVVVGKDAPRHAAELIQMLGTQPSLMPLVKAAVWVGERRWNLTLNNEIDVRMPEQNPEAAWAQLAEYQNKHQVLTRDVEVLDLRLPGRLIVRKTAAPAAKAKRRPGQDT